jgi:hypothetical protein
MLQGDLTACIVHSGGAQLRKCPSALSQSVQDSVSDACQKAASVARKICARNNKKQRKMSYSNPAKNLGIVLGYTAIDLGELRRTLVTLKLLEAKPLKAPRIHDLC